LQLQITNKQLKIEQHISSPSVIFTDISFLQTIVRNLMQNAIQAAPEHSTIIIQYNNFMLSIENEGSAFTQIQYNASVAQPNTHLGTTGLGLQLVEQLSNRLQLSLSYKNPSATTTVATIQGFQKT
jgi:signal transduction histidine kinase